MMCIRPHIFSRASSLFIPLSSISIPCLPGFLVCRDVLLFTNTVEELVVSVTHDQVHTDKVVDGAEATGRDVALYMRADSLAIGSCLRT